MYTAWRLPAVQRLNASVVEAFCQVVTLSNTLVHVVKVAGLVQANCQSHDVTAGHAAVGIVAVAGDLLNLQQNANVGLNGAVFVEVGEVFQNRPLSRNASMPPMLAWPSFLADMVNASQ